MTNKGEVRKIKHSKSVHAESLEAVHTHTHTHTHKVFRNK